MLVIGDIVAVFGVFVERAELSNVYGPGIAVFVEKTDVSDVSGEGVSGHIGT